MTRHSCFTHQLPSHTKLGVGIGYRLSEGGGGEGMKKTKSRCTAPMTLIPPAKSLGPINLGPQHWPLVRSIWTHSISPWSDQSGRTALAPTGAVHSCSSSRVVRAVMSGRHALLYRDTAVYFCCGVFFGSHKRRVFVFRACNIGSFWPHRRNYLRAEPTRLRILRRAYGYGLAFILFRRLLSI